MGEIHLAYSGHAELKKLCVIKTILGHLVDEEFVNRFLDEAKVVVKLSHGNLVPVFEAGQAEGQNFFAMEYIEGRDLRDLWNRLETAGRRCPLEVALYIVREVCRGLSYVHSFEDLHLVHRDVSPPNVLLSYTGEVRLTDFGVATSTIKLQKTAPGILLGKLSYMSPEQARNEAVDARADVYSVGVILWELLTGQRLFPADKSQLERYERAVNPVIPPPSMINQDLPPSLDLVTLRALAPSRDTRFADAELLRRELASTLARLSPTTDSHTLQSLVKELYGPEIEQERDERRQLLESMAREVRALMDPSSGLIAESTGQLQADVGGTPGSAATEKETGPLPILAAGTLLGDRYRIEALIGEGGMGTVYVATHVEIEKQVAVKVLHPAYSRMPDLVSRFRQEARAASRIGHPHIIEVFDSGTTTDGSIYFVMENLDGIDLADVLDQEGQLNIDRALQIAIQICEAVAAAHDAGIIHRDLKPENIFLTTREGAQDFVKVLDFGIAKTTELEDTNRARLTFPGMAMGTPEYMAPEQAAGLKTDRRTDVYAAGALLYEMICGRPPHSGDNLMAVLNRKATEPVTPPREIRPEVPEPLEQLLLWTLEYDPEKRPQTMAQMCYELNKLTRGRAGAVASLLGIPGVTGPSAGPSVTIRPAPTEKVAAFDPPDFDPVARTQTVAWHPAEPARKTWVWLVPLLVASGGLSAGALLFLRAPSVSPRRDGGALARLALGPPRDASAPSRRPGPDAARVPDAGPAPDAEPDPALREGQGNGSRPRLPHLHGASGQRHLSAGRQYLMAGDFGGARIAFQAAARVPRLQGPALTGLAEVEFQLGAFNAAERYAADAVKHGGGLRASLVLGNIYFKLGDYGKAAQKYREVLARDRNHKEARRNLAAAEKRLGQ
jgi:serine/threonine protein kinase